MSLGEAHCSQTSLNGEVKAMLSAGLVFLLALHAARRAAGLPLPTRLSKMNVNHPEHHASTQRCLS